MEYFDIVDESGLPTGEIVSRDIAHRDGIRHRTAHVWVVRPAHAGYDILLQKRSRNKDSFPGFFDTSSAGHIPAGSEPLPSALRELKEGLEFPHYRISSTMPGYSSASTRKNFTAGCFGTMK